jgi:peptidoglycan/LPS O-acetylase OafA/YrhL
MQRNPFIRTDGQTLTDYTMMQENLVADQNRGGGIGTSGTSRFEWVDVMKAFAILWVFLNHATEKLFGFPYFANPLAGWPSPAVQVDQLAPIAGFGVWDIPLNLTRWIGWSGGWGTQLFLILSGFGLTWGLLTKGAPDKLRLWQYYSRRLRRIFPPWWAAHAVAFLAALAGGYAILTDYRFYLSFAGIRATPELLYYIQPGWWFIGLLIQLYLVFPWLWTVLRKQGAARFFIYLVVIPVCVRLLGLLYFEEYLDAWSRGAVFITRLPEFALGMMLASWLHGDPARRLSQLKAGKVWLAGIIVYVSGLIASFFLTGMAVAPALMGVGAFLLLFKPIQWIVDRVSWLRVPLLWIGLHSYAFYLLHGFAVRVVVPDGLSTDILIIYARVILALVLSCVAAFVFDLVMERTMKRGAHA